MKAISDLCWLCGRPLGKKVELHHVIPKKKGGRETVPLHPICHRAIHANFSNAQLARNEGRREYLLKHENIQGFVEWVAGKAPDFHAPTRRRR